MRKITIFSFFVFITICCVFSQQSFADAKPWVWSWYGSHWENQDFEPYLEPAKEPHGSQWNKDPWQPEHWTAQRGGDETSLIRGFYNADILRDQYMDDDLPVLEVGPAFYQLGGHDKRRVVQMVDQAYGVTSDKLFGMFMLYDWRTKDAIGAYTQYGLQLQ